MKKIVLLIIVMIIITGCSSMEKKMMEKDPFYRSFYITTRFIMTDYEKNMYKFLPDAESRESFIKEFWLRRDPTPNTEENENYEDFQNRIEYANKYFRGRTLGQGWNTVRGRILLQLGFPIERRKDRYNSRVQTTSMPYELWHYPRFQLVLTFIDRKDSGKFELMDPPPGLLSSIDEAIYEFDIHEKFRGKSTFKFKGYYENNNLILNFPTKNILFKEEGDLMTAEFKFDIRVSLNYKKMDSFVVNKVIKEKKSDLLKLSNIKIPIQYELKQKGKFYFDVLITDVINKSRYRRFVSYKNK